MSKLTLVLLAAFTFVGCQQSVNLDSLKAFSAVEVYPDDHFLDTVQNKTALVLVAHDDDDCAMSGTIAQLTRKGWTIYQISLTKHHMPGKEDNPASIICRGNLPLLRMGNYRIGLDTMKTPYLPIPYEQMDNQFYGEKLRTALKQVIQQYQPSVLFSLDDVKGGYGHPEHIYLSHLLVDLLQKEEIKVSRIYQSVYTHHMEHEIVDVWLKAKMKEWGYPHASTIANEMYGISGMPEPTVQINIVEDSETKMKYLRAYPESVKKNLRKFIPYYEDFSAEEYFSVFPYEYFRVIE